MRMCTLKKGLFFMFGILFAWILFITLGKPYRLDGILKGTHIVDFSKMHHNKELSFEVISKQTKKDQEIPGSDISSHKRSKFDIEAISDETDMVRKDSLAYNTARYQCCKEILDNGQIDKVISNEDEKYRITDKHSNVFESRWNHVVKTCVEEGRTPPKDVEHSKLLPKMILELPHNILYCPVEKVASTFWKKTLTAMNSLGFYKSPFQVKGKRYKVKSYIHHLQYTTDLNVELFRKHATSLLVVRDPYSKVFSAYVDKLFHPNAIFWNYIGIPIEKIIENKKDNNQTLCGHAVKFSEYIRYLIYKNDKEDNLNAHFTTITSHCDPCVTKYDYISKLETFRDDFYAIMSEWNRTFDVNLKFKDFDRETAIDIARVHINLALYTKAETENKCVIPKNMFLKRTWRFLQISGIIPKQVDVPTNWYHYSFKQRSEYLLLDVLQVLNSKISWSTVKKQRQEAMLQAYRTVDIQDLYKLRDLVKSDCRYFGYEDMPKEIFSRSTSSYFQDFDYFDAVK